MKLAEDCDTSKLILTRRFHVTRLSYRSSQAVLTFIQYANKSWNERLARSFLALLGLAPVLEGAGVWTGKEDTELVLSSPVMYATMKGIELAFESIPESIIQVNGLLRANIKDINGIQIVGVISSIVAGAYIMTDGNFGINQSLHLAQPGFPHLRWISKSGAW